MNKIIRAGIYIRVSTEEQAKHGYSIESQRSRLIEWAKEHNYQIVDVYADEGKSARTKISNRKELLRLLEDVKNDKIDRIIIWRLDRWFRNVADYYRIQDILDKNNVDWECSDEDYNTSTSNGRLYLNIKLSIAQNESDQTSDRIKFNFDNMIKNKRPISGALPIGYKVAGEKQNKRVVKDPELSQMVIDMFDKFEETLSIKQTMIYLNENYPQRPIVYEALKNHLQKTQYYGMYRGVEDFCEPYITKERHDKICDLIKKNKKKYPRSEHVYLFSGLIRCYDCKTRMGGSRSVRRKRLDGTQKKVPTYKCNRKYIGTCSNGHAFIEDRLEQWLIDNFLTKLNEYVVSVEEIKDNRKVKDTSAKLKRLNEKLDRLNDLYIDGRISKDKYNTEYKTVKNEIKSLSSIKTEEKTRNLKKYKKLLNDSNALDIYKKLTRENKKLFWFEYIDAIEQDPENPLKSWIIFFK